MKRLISYLLSIALLIGIIPATSVGVLAAENEPYSIDNGYIRVQVSKKNGGFTVNSVNGDILKKSDNNKELLFHNDEYDTSFVSFRVEESGGTVKEYVFGGEYGNSSDPSHRGVEVTQATENGDITARWSVENYTFIQTITLANADSNEHGMVSVSLSALNSQSSAVNVKARVLLDTALGNKDYAFYQAVDQNSVTRTITTEQILNGSEYPIPQNFYGIDDMYNPAVMAYSVNSPQSMPYQVAFGHWNNLASTVFDFAPNSSMDFTNASNDYLTADSAYALYYDLGSVSSSTPVSIVSYYGVYSHNDVSVSESFAVDATVPFRLELNDEKNDFIRLTNEGIADFTAGVTFENYESETAKDYSNIVLAVKTTGNLRPLGDMGAESGVNFASGDTFTIPYTDVKVGDVISKTLYFEANPTYNAAYERITIGVYDVSNTSGQIAEENKLGEKIVYILLPGSDGNIPRVKFTSMTPQIIYSSGTRHLFVAGENTALLDNRGNWNMVAYSADGKTSHTINPDLITIKDGVMDIVIEDNVEMAPGSWYLQLEWTEAAVQADVVEEKYKNQTSSQLNFTVSEDIKYKNDSYGILAVIEYTENHSSVYKLKSFRNESDFEAFKKERGYTEILLIFRGEFTQQEYVVDNDGRVGTYYTAVSTKTLNQETREYEVDNCINVNGSMDFEGGTMSIYYEQYKVPGGANAYSKSPILVEFDGELLTSDARTSVWKGKAALTKIEQGVNYSLIPYDKNGNRDEDFTDETVKLIWPSVYSAGQTLAGLIFNMAYGELGVMNDGGTEIGRVLSFSANLDLRFVSPAAGQEPKDTYWSKIKEFWQFYREDQSIYDYAYNSGSINKVFDWSNIDESTGSDKEITASVMVRDILFGCGEGFIGMNFSVDVGIQNYVTALPKISGTLEVNTINDWAFKVKGGLKLSTFSLEAKLSFKSRDDVPVPDDIYFYIGGFKPGINIDACGVVWITGGGGGISNLYDTVFMTKAVPPLKLVMTASFSIVQILDGKASLSVGATGISLKGEDLKILGVIDAIERVYLGLEWYPGIDLKASISVDLFQGVIEGGGYIVLIGKNYTDWFFEMYARAAIKIPKSVPLVGGVTVANADLGISSEKIWGNIKVLFIGLGITYYWGNNSVDFGTGETMAKPTFPSLLGCEDVPICYDAERDQTLYARFGTNIGEPFEAEVIDNSTVPKLMDAGIYSNGELTIHKFNLGVYQEENSAAIVQINYDAESLEDAQSKAKTIRVNTSQNMDGTDYQLVVYNGENIDTANANVTFNSEEQSASYSFTVTNPDDYNKDWFITTGTTKANVILYNVEPVPELKDISGSISGNELALNWNGISTDELDKISFYLSETNNPSESDGGVFVGIVDNKSVLSGSGNTTLKLPAETPTGKYYIRAVYSKEDEVNGVIFSSSQVSYTNTNTPADAEIENFFAAGNLEFGVTIKETSDSKTTGYMATVYNEDGTETDAAGLTFEKSSSGNTSFSIGGAYKGQDENGNEKTYGLAGGKRYKVGVTPYCLTNTDENGKIDTVVYGKEIFTEIKTLPEMSTPTVTVEANQEKQDIEDTVMADHDDNPDTPAQEVTVTRETYTSNIITFTAAISEPSTGEWELDGALTENDGGRRAGYYGSFSDSTSVSIPLEGITDGSHTLTVTGRDNQGDSFSFSYQFDVDTTPPRLMLSSPVNGSLFSADGTLIVSGLTDNDARFTITSDGTELCKNMTVAQMGGSINTDGVFSFNVPIYDPNGASSRSIVITASDPAGNTVTEKADVTHGGMAKLKELQILVDDTVIDNGNIPVVYSGQSEKQLSLAGVTDTGTVFKLTGPNVNWECIAVEGDATVNSDGKLVMQSHSQGMITGRLEVTKGAYMTNSLSFGADSGSGIVAVSSSVGGKVTGGGTYVQGETVTLSAMPDNGYEFGGWEINGVSVTDTTSPTISFVMPGGNVVAYASFSAKKPSTSGGGGWRPNDKDETKPGDIITEIDAEKGERVEYKLTAPIESDLVAQYSTDGGMTYITVAKSAVIDGVFVFIAPVTAKYRIVKASGMEFNDMASHWALDYVDFTSARKIVNGIDDNIFAPDENMTRAMFVTMLGRMHGNMGDYNKHSFADVEKDSWYEDYVSWAAYNGIVEGYDAEHFAPNDKVTREQICTMIDRYLKYAGCNIDAAENDKFIDDEQISDWAYDAVAYVKNLEIVNGYEDGSFKPQGLATRAEASAMFTRLIYTLLKNR